MSFLYFILVFFLVVNIHEFGHFLFAKIFGVKVEEYGFGWPPKVLSKIYKGTRYSLNLILAGGFVKLFGKDPEEKKALTSKESFQTKSFYKKILIILGGIVFNLFLSYIIFYFLFLVGFPRLSEYKSDEVYIHSVTKDSPAYEAGLKVGDSIVSVADVAVDDYTKLGEIVSSFSNQEIKVSVERNEDFLEVIVVPDPLLGVGVSPIPLEKSNPLVSAGLAFKETFKVAGEVISVFYNFLRGEREGIEISGPIGIAKYSGQSAKMGAAYFWQFVAILSINLAVLNLIPFPALDGGWAALLIIEKVRRKRLNSKVVNLVNTFGFAIIIALLILVTIRDLVG